MNIFDIKMLKSFMEQMLFRYHLKYGLKWLGLIIWVVVMLAFETLAHVAGFDTILFKIKSFITRTRDHAKMDENRNKNRPKIDCFEENCYLRK